MAGLTGYWYRKAITIKTTNIVETLTDFPVLVVCDSTIMTALADNVNFNDIRFTDTSDNILPYEKESASSVSGYFWVKVTLNTSSNIIYCYYHNPLSQTDGSSKTTTWNSGYKGVWHLTSPTSMTDSTSNGYTLAAYSGGATPGSTAGKISNAVSFNGSSQNAGISGANSPNLQTSNDQTWEGWVNSSNFTNNALHRLISRFNSNTTNYFNLYVYPYGAGTTNRFAFAVAGVTVNGSAEGVIYAPSSITDNTWYHIVGVYDRTNGKQRIYVNGVKTEYSITSGVYTVSNNAFNLADVMDYVLHQYSNVNIDEVRMSNVVRSDGWIQFQYNNINSADNELTFGSLELFKDKTIYTQGKDSGTGALPFCNDSSVGTDLIAWKKFQTLLKKSVNGGTIFSKEIVSTYPLVYTKANEYLGGVLDPNGNIHFVPADAVVGQKISPLDVISTYSLVYTVSFAYCGGVLALNGDIHFVPFSAARGQKVSANGVVSTYSLVYTTANAYQGGYLSPSGEIHFIPFAATVGQKISATGVVSTYSLVYTLSGGYSGGILSSNGDIHFIPSKAVAGQKISADGVVSTYSIVYTNSSGGYQSGVLAPNGDIHFVPQFATVGQKIDINGVVSTYSLVYTNASGAYTGGVLSPNGDVHFIPLNAVVGQKVSFNSIVSTYSLVYTIANAYLGGILTSNGNIHFIPYNATLGQKISTTPVIPFSLAVCQSPFFNKL